VNEAAKKIIDKLKCCGNCDYACIDKTPEDYVRCVNCSREGNRLPNWINKTLAEILLEINQNIKEEKKTNE